MSEVLHRTREEVEEIASRLGLACVIPEPNEIVLDIDEGHNFNDAVLKCLRDNGLVIESELFTTSKNGNTHIYLRVKVDPRGTAVLKLKLAEEEQIDFEGEGPHKAELHMSPLVRIALQACLGSDPVKEVLSLMRCEAWDAPIAMFETPTEYAKVEKWRAEGRIKKVSARRRK